MNSNVVYGNAPIIEALGQINFQISDGGWPKVEAWAAEQSAETVEDIFQVQIPALGEPTKKVFGKRLLFPKQQLSIQATRDFLAVSQTGGYEDWSAFFGKLRSFFDTFMNACDVSNISRSALRYINQFEFDAAESPALYLSQLSPKTLGKDFEGRITTLASTYNIARSSVEAVIQQSLELRPSASKWVVTMDIDVFMNKPIKADIIDLGLELETLRKYKNQIFESLLTEGCRERFR